MSNLISIQDKVVNMGADHTSKMKLEMYKGNKIIGGKGSITLQDERYINICLSRQYKKELLNKDTWYGLDVAYYAEKAHISKAQAYVELRSIATTLRRATIFVPVDEDKTLEFGWITTIMFDNTSYTLAVKWHEQVIPFISGFTAGNYTIIHETVNMLGSLPTRTFYEILKKESFKKYFLIGVYDLQILIGTKYKRYTDFKTYFLEPAIQQINALSDVFILVTEKKKGRKVENLHFTIRKQETKTIKHNKRNCNGT